MKKILLILFSSLLGAGINAQFPVNVDTLFTFIRYNSIHQKGTDWQNIESNFHTQLIKSSNMEDTMKCFVKILETLNDVHSQLFFNNKFYGHYPDFDEQTLAWIMPIHNRSLDSVNKVHTRILSYQIGYINVPGYNAYQPEVINKYAQELNDAVTNLAKVKLKGFIIDLRLNGGGNLYPMLAGLSLLLGNTTLGYEVNVEGKEVRKWHLKDENFYMNDYQLTNIKTTTNKKLSSIPVVLLIGPITKSSGSMTAIAFKGRKNTYFIGEPTATGYTTSNGYFQFAPNLWMNFSSAFVADRNHMVYESTVNPDQFVFRGDNFDDFSKDEKIMQATLWIMHQK